MDARALKLLAEAERQVELRTLADAQRRRPRRRLARQPVDRENEHTSLRDLQDADRALRGVERPRHVHVESEHELLGRELERGFRLVERRVIDDDPRHPQRVADRVQSRIHGRGIHDIGDQTVSAHAVSFEVGHAGIHDLLTAHDEPDRPPAGCKPLRDRGAQARTSTDDREHVRHQTDSLGADRSLRLRR